MCVFCRMETRELIGSQSVVNCCDLGYAAICMKPDSEITIAAGELADIMSRIADTEWQVERRNKTIERLWWRRHGLRSKD